MPLKTLQIAVLGGSDEAVLVGLRNFPAHKLILITSPNYSNQANELAGKLTSTLKLTVDVMQLTDEAIPAMLETVGQIIHKESGNFQDFLINVGSADKHSTAAGVTAAFVHGIKAFDVTGEQPAVLPIMKFSYTQVITRPKMKILQAIESSGGDIESLEKLSDLSSYGKPLLSYHIRGSEDGEGLEELGLVEVERGKRGRLRVKLTPLGRTLLSTAPLNSTA
jgi:DNA-binding MarR family transcriptional regulator